MRLLSSDSHPHRHQPVSLWEQCPLMSHLASAERWNRKAQMSVRWSMRSSQHGWYAFMESKKTSCYRNVKTEGLQKKRRMEIKQCATSLKVQMDGFLTSVTVSIGSTYKLTNQFTDFYSKKNRRLSLPLNSNYKSSSAAEGVISPYCAHTHSAGLHNMERLSQQSKAEAALFLRCRAH